MNQFSNIAKVITMATPSWDEARRHGLLGIRAEYIGGPKLRTAAGHDFINMCSCSYLALDRHPKIVNAAMNAVSRAGVLLLSTSRTRIGHQLIDEAEEALSGLFCAECIVTISCGAASAGMLSLFASGALTDDEKPLMVFDKHCHFSMNFMKPICGDETEVTTCKHNDLQFLEDQCHGNRKIVYVADGAYSMGGYAPVDELRIMQEKYGLYLYFDDSHALSAYGPYGAGFVRSKFGELSGRTVIVASLGKAFGASGGIVMLGPRMLRERIDVFGGPMGWSQSVNTAGLGAILGSVDVHRSTELGIRQRRLRENISHFDSLCPTIDAGNDLPIRVIELDEPQVAIELSGQIFKRGFYTSAIFFPIVASGRAALRVMVRADLSLDDIGTFYSCVEAARTAMTSTNP